MVIVIGIDPGSRHCGYGVVLSRGSQIAALEGGLLAVPDAAPLERRLAALHTALLDLIDRHRPDAVAVEDLYFGRNARSAMAVGQARGAVLAAAGARGVPCFSYTPQQVKLAVCGSGSAPKQQVQRMVKALLALASEPRPDHAADALAVAICHAQHAPLREALA
ncbi:crossover junction endodeoxyribonuclease RuvC [Thermoleophilum album]|uniref:Crossover junction endodeoxyribonuclease RuvC n=1 Tax=Thermoleophilum album TaxID=29539 RepID=A0A1H6FWQ0_THEAL|nr:crossover junction endodeoxyribonuclease RuvC [Thermoleophilum album]SEH14224.1 Holliday junction endonuclease RuvC [Thermoleophilum album]